MEQFLALILIYIFFIYLIERRVRHFVQRQNMSPFDEKFLAKINWITRLFKFSIGWSNFILGIGGTLTIALIITDITRNGYTMNIGFLTSISLFVSFFTLSVAASFPGETWIKKINIWISSINQKLATRVLKRLAFEMMSVVFLVIPFLLFLFAILLWYLNGSDSVVRLRLFFYYLPIFLVLWVYRWGDYDEFEMNIRRFIVYLFVALAYLSNKDPLSQLLTQSTKTQNTVDFLRLFTDFTVIAFLTLDRIGKVGFEIFSKGWIKAEMTKTE